MKVYKATNGTFQCQECNPQHWQLDATTNEVIIICSWNYELVLCKKDARKLQQELNEYFSEEREEK